MPQIIKPSAESANSAGPHDHSGTGITLARLDDWFRFQDRLARLEPSSRKRAAVFYAWTRVRRPAATACLDADAAVAEAERMLAFFLSDAGWATTPPGELGLNRIARCPR